MWTWRRGASFSQGSLELSIKNWVTVLNVLEFEVPWVKVKVLRTIERKIWVIKNIQIWSSARVRDTCPGVIASQGWANPKARWVSQEEEAQIEAWNKLLRRVNRIWRKRKGSASQTASETSHNLPLKMSFPAYIEPQGQPEVGTQPMCLALYVQVACRFPEICWGFTKSIMDMSFPGLFF